MTTTIVVTTKEEVETLVLLPDTTKLNATALSGLTKITVGTTEPTNPSVGDLWIDTN